MGFSPDGRWFAAGGQTGLMMLWEVATQQAKLIARAHLNQINSLAFSPDGRRLITSGTGTADTLKVWDVESGRDVATLTGEAGFYDLIRFSPDGKTVFATANNGTVLLWRAPSFEEIEAREQAKAR